MGRDVVRLPNLGGVKNFTAFLVVALGGWTIGHLMGFATVPTVVVALEARVICILSTLCAMIVVLIGSVVG